MHLALKIALAPVLVVQAWRTRGRALMLPEAAGARAGVLDAALPVGARPPQGLRVLVAGDSSAAGVGVDRQERAFAGHLVRALHAQLRVPVSWALHARTGLSTRGVHALLEAGEPRPADVAVVVSGVNDVTTLLPVRRALADRAALADWLLGSGLARHVVFAPLPPIDRFPLLPEPLRRVLGADARRHDAALATWARSRTGVSHAAFEIELGADSMAADGYHPGEPVYRACGEAIAAHVAQAVWPALSAARENGAQPAAARRNGAPTRDP
jgi:lysophospholipase L1-like esterase